nr:TadE family protein [Microlunatus panaciterrae]
MRRASPGQLDHIYRGEEMKRQRSERGAAVVEFALIVPMLLLLVLGIAEFGRAYNIQTTLSGAAREGVRVMALNNNVAAAKTAAKNAAPTLNLTDTQISVTPGTCVVTAATPTPTATVQVTYPMSFLSGFFGTTITLRGKGVMRCNG